MKNRRANRIRIWVIGMNKLLEKALLAIIACLVIVGSYADNIEQTSRYRSMAISGELSTGEKFSAFIELFKVKCDVYNSKKHFYGIDRPCPDTQIGKLELRISDKAVEIPKEKYQDLADISLPLGFYVMQLGKEVRLYVKGGDGIAAYTAGFHIVDGKLVARSIEEMNPSGEMEKKIIYY